MAEITEGMSKTIFDPFIYGLWNYKVKDFECFCSSKQSCFDKMMEIIGDTSNDFKTTDFGIKNFFLYD